MPIQVGSTVEFIGPEYSPDIAGSVPIGTVGTITECDGHWSQRVGENREEMATVKFNGHAREVVLPLARLREIDLDGHFLPDGDTDHDNEDRQVYRAELNERPRPSEY